MIYQIGYLLNLKPIYKCRRVSKRNRESCRLPIRTIECLKNKSRKVRMLVYERISLTIPKSSKLYCYLQARKQENKAKFILKCSEKFSHRIVKSTRRAYQYFSLFSCNKRTSLQSSTPSIECSDLLCNLQYSSVHIYLQIMLNSELKLTVSNRK